jgi:hypothetical protein
VVKALSAQKSWSSDLTYRGQLSDTVYFICPKDDINHKFDFDEKFVKSKKLNTHGKIRIHSKLFKSMTRIHQSSDCVLMSLSLGIGRGIKFYQCLHVGSYIPHLVVKECVYRTWMPLLLARGNRGITPEWKKVVKSTI